MLGDFDGHLHGDVGLIFEWATDGESIGRRVVMDMVFGRAEELKKVGARIAR